MPGPHLRRSALLGAVALTLGLGVTGCGSGAGNGTPRAAVMAYNAAAARQDYAAVCRLLQPVAWAALTGGSTKVTCEQAIASTDGRYQLHYYHLSDRQIRAAKLTVYDNGKLAILRTGGNASRAYALRHTSSGWLIDSP